MEQLSSNTWRPFCSAVSHSAHSFLRVSDDISYHVRRFLQVMVIYRRCGLVMSELFDAMYQCDYTRLLSL